LFGFFELCRAALFSLSELCHATKFGKTRGRTICSRQFAAADLQPPICSRQLAAKDDLQPPICSHGSA
jgi:hypothetical protein